jgi:multicomponent Na+:H+ antiporter subunit D
VLLFASAGVFHHAGIKIPYFAFFAHDSGKRCPEAPANMLTAMAIAAALSIGIGVFPDVFYSLLPYKVDFRPYSLDHVVAQVQLLFLSALAFTLLMRTGIYPPELRSTNLDFDWIYRRLGRSLVLAAARTADVVWNWIVEATTHGARAAIAEVRHYYGPEGIFARSWPTGSMAFWTTVMLMAYLLLSNL